jgi:hypothetical protein
MSLVVVIEVAGLPAVHPKLPIYYEWVRPLLPSEPLLHLMFRALLGHARAKFFFPFRLTLAERR